MGRPDKLTVGSDIVLLRVASNVNSQDIHTREINELKKKRKLAKAGFSICN